MKRGSEKYVLLELTGLTSAKIITIAGGIICSFILTRQRQAPPRMTRPMTRMIPSRLFRVGAAGPATHAAGARLCVCARARACLRAGWRTPRLSVRSLAC